MSEDEIGTVRDVRGVICTVIREGQNSIRHNSCFSVVGHSESGSSGGWREGRGYGWEKKTMADKIDK